MERHYNTRRNTHHNTHHNMHPPMFAGMSTTRITRPKIETTEITESHFGGIYDR